MYVYMYVYCFMQYMYANNLCNKLKLLYVMSFHIYWLQVRGFIYQNKGNYKLSNLSNLMFAEKYLDSQLYWEFS